LSNAVRSISIPNVLLLASLLAGALSQSDGLLGTTQTETANASIKERLNRVSADLFSRKDRTNEAIRELKAMLALEPRLAEAHFLLGIAYRLAGSAELMGEAVAELRQALALNPSYVPARYYLAQLYIDLGRPERAREELDAALKQVTGNPQFLALLGETERQLKRPGRAVEILEQALKADESFAQTRYYLGLALFDLGRRSEAVAELERVVQSAPSVPEPYVSLGTAYVEAGRFDEALKVLSLGTQIDPGRVDMRIQMARAYRSKGQLNEADAQLKMALSRGAAALASPFAEHQQAEFDLYLELGLLRVQQGRLESAIDAFQKVLDMDPKHALTNRYMAEARKRLQQERQKKKAGEP
jgi:tetratricopeptide (TPR) repeat protein